MPSPFSSLLLATSLLALPSSADARPPAASSLSQAPSTSSGSSAKTAAPATSKGKRGAKASPTSKVAAPKAPVKSKDARKADCDTPEPKATAAKAPPVPVDPFAPVVAPCAETKP
jgi:hypothetical protein